MNPSRRLLISLLILPLFGWGCLRIGPRIARVPEAPTPVVTPSEQQSENAQAYLRLDGGVADVARSGAIVQAREGTELVAGDEVSVTSGTVALVYPDAGESQLEAGTKIAILADGKEEGTAFTEIRLIAGGIWTRFEKLFGADEQFSVAANSVVATVRGTAFGVSIEDGEVDIQVADHEVEITSEEVEAAAVTSKQRVAAAKLIRLAPGDGVRLKADSFTRLDERKLKSLVRKLSAIERSKKGFTFGTMKISQDRLKRPASPFKLPGLPTIPQKFLQRMLFLRQRAALETSLRGFIAPTRGVLQNEFTPLDATIQIQGPTSTP